MLDGNLDNQQVNAGAVVPSNHMPRMIPPPPAGTLPRQDDLAKISERQIVDQTSFVKKHLNDMKYITSTVDGLACQVATLAHQINTTHPAARTRKYWDKYSNPGGREEMRWHPEDYSQPYTWDQFWEESKKQLHHDYRRRYGNRYVVPYEEITQKAIRMWDSSSKA